MLPLRRRSRYAQRCWGKELESNRVVAILDPIHSIKLIAILTPLSHTFKYPFRRYATFFYNIAVP